MIYTVSKMTKENTNSEVPSPTVKMNFLLVLTLVRANMEDHSQLSRWKMSKHFYDH